MKLIFVFLSVRRPPRTTLTDTLCTYATFFRSLVQPAGAARVGRAVGADRGRAALRDRHAAAAFGQSGAAHGLARRFRALPARERVDVGAYGADAGAAGVRHRGGAGRGEDRKSVV